MPAGQSRPSTLNWRKSHVSNAQGECVEIACTRSAVLVRDSRNTSGALLSCTPSQWSAFLRRVRGGELEDTGAIRALWQASGYPPQSFLVENRYLTLAGTDNLP